MRIPSAGRTYSPPQPASRGFAGKLGRAAGAAADGLAGGVAGLNMRAVAAAQSANKRNTVLLALAMLGLGGGLGYLAGELWQPGAGLTGAGLMLVGSGLYTLYALTAGDRMVLGATGAHTLAPGSAPQLEAMVAKVAAQAGVPTPAIALVPSPEMNAFATGLSPQKATVGFTEGIVRNLSADELEAVTAHEMGHVLNNDVRYMTVVSVMVGMIALAADAARWGGYGGAGRRGEDGRGGNGLIVLFGLALAVLAPLAAQMVRMAVSRQREYLADATAARLTGKPEALIHALEKLQAQPVGPVGQNRAVQHLFIVNPVLRFGPNIGALMSTHPATEDRIARLQELAIQMRSGEGAVSPA